YDHSQRPDPRFGGRDAADELGDGRRAGIRRRRGRQPEHSGQHVVRPPGRFRPVDPVEVVIDITEVRAGDGGALAAAELNAPAAGDRIPTYALELRGLAVSKAEPVTAVE